MFVMEPSEDWACCTAMRVREGPWPATANPVIRDGCDRKLAHFGQGLTIIRSSQCPHIAKFASDIAVSAANEYGITPTTR